MNGIGNYDHTPSYFNNLEYFNKYLGKTSYYYGLQHALSTIIAKTKPQRVLELGCALGNTTFLLANMFLDIEFCGIDMRDDIVSKTNKTQECRDFQGKDNASFVCDDMTRYVKKDELASYDLIYMLYSFHHILDPNENKKHFLLDCIEHMKSNGFLFVGETFLPEGGMSISELWNIRAEEGYSSTFWNSFADDKLSNLNNGIIKAQEASITSYNEERDAGIHVENRTDEYLITRSWLANTAEKVGFSIVINEPTNALGDGVILLQKR